MIPDGVRPPTRGGHAFRQRLQRHPRHRLVDVGGAPSSLNHTADSAVLAAIQRSRRVRFQAGQCAYLLQPGGKPLGPVATWMPGPQRSGLLNIVV